MIHYRPTHGQPAGQGGAECDPSLYRDCFMLVEALASRVREARHAADESLHRALDAPEPHETTNTIFVAHWDRHLRDRETLFETMRRLDAAREELRQVVAGSPDRSSRDGPSAV